MRWKGWLMVERRPGIVLLAEDDPADRRLFAKAIERNRLDYPLHCVSDGEELLDYLHGRAAFADEQRRVRPALILLDLNMPRKDGSQALREIKGDPALRDIPIVVLTTSSDDADISRSYALGCNAYVTKPVTLDGLVEVVRVLGEHWLRTVTLPVRPLNHANGI